jgi:hypothetical protein
VKGNMHGDMRNSGSVGLKILRECSTSEICYRLGNNDNDIVNWFWMGSSCRLVNTVLKLLAS